MLVAAPSFTAFMYATIAEAVDALASNILDESELTESPSPLLPPEQGEGLTETTPVVTQGLNAEWLPDKSMLKLVILLPVLFITIQAPLLVSPPGSKIVMPAEVQKPAPNMQDAVVPSANVAVAIELASWPPVSLSVTLVALKTLPTEDDALVIEFATVDAAQIMNTVNTSAVLTLSVLSEYKATVPSWYDHSNASVL